MRVLVAAAAFSARISGIQRHALNVVRCLLQHKEISAVQLVVAPWQREMLQADWLAPGERLTIHVAEMKTSSLSRNIWYYRELPLLAARLQTDVVHLTYPVPVNRRAFDCAMVATLHDLYPYEIPENFGFPKVIVNRQILRHCLRNVDAIACVSDSTLLQMQRYIPRSVWGRATRIYNCVEPELLCSLGSSIPGWRGEPFLLSVAQHRRNKNLPLLLWTFHRLLRTARIDASMKLIIVGIAGPETASIERLVSDLGVQQSVVFLSGLSEPDLQWCYRRCQALVVPSQTEGFGLPVAEALLAGCRVVCSDIPAFREVGGEHCRYFVLGPGAENALADGVVAALCEQAKPPVALPQLLSAVLAEEYVRLYRAVVAARSQVQNKVSSQRLHTATGDRGLL
jgi:glycosyltransferase involved in cell wall biosynthesis